jgi:DNA-damage-inducible protein D
MNAHSIDRATWNLSMKNPNEAEEAALREPLETVDEILALDAEKGGDSDANPRAVATEVAVSNQHHQTFESIKRTDPDGAEFWRARQIAPLLEYHDYRNFQNVVAKAKTACKTAGYVVADHFGDFTEMVPIGSGAIRRISDIRLSRYACYLIVQNGDPSKPVIALGQTYFAIQTRRQELQEGAGAQRLSEDDRRLRLRSELSAHNEALSAAAKQSGVETSLDYVIFQDHGYRGLYGELGVEEIQSKKGLKKSQQILDYMDSTELAANLFRATQTEAKLRREGVKDKLEANALHLEVGRKVRKTIEELGGAMPEDLPRPTKSIAQIERERKKAIARDDSGKK